MASANPPQMIYRRFGRTELQMPVFSCGGMRYQDGWSDKPLSEVDPAGQANLEATIHRAVEVGINHIETARGYGSSERQLGLVLPKLPRKEIIVQTKIGPSEDPATFRKEFMESLERLQLDHVDLLALHGVNNREKLEWSIRPGGCFDVAQELRAEGLCNFIGFATHGPVDVILDAIRHGKPETGAGFDYVNLHWYYIYQETWPCIEEAARRDMGVFIISPSDKGGKLYAPPEKLQRLCKPLHPMTFNDLFCLSHPEVKTLSIGAARPSDFDEHLEALPLLGQAAEVLGPILTRLRTAYEEAVEPTLRSPWELGVPRWQNTPGQINIGRVVQLRNLALAYDMIEYGKMRYNLLGNGNDWFPGFKADPERLAEAGDALVQAIADSPAKDLILPALKQAHDLLADKEVKRLSQSED